jgi:hypothetical protein
MAHWSCSAHTCSDEVLAWSSRLTQLLDLVGLAVTPADSQSREEPADKEVRASLAIFRVVSLH